MTYSDDIRWRIVGLMHVYDMDVSFLSDLFGPKVRTIQRWYQLFKERGVVRENRPPNRRSRWPQYVVDAAKIYCQAHPTFYLEELREYIVENFPEVTNVSLSTICRAINFDMKLTRKILTKAAREAAPEEIRNYFSKLNQVYMYPHQLVFVDETSKDGRDAYRKYARSPVGEKAVVRLPFRRGHRVSVLAAVNADGFIGWKTTRDTFTRQKFHDAFAECVIPKLNPYPLPNSIVIMDNAKIHMYRELEEAIHQCGALLIYLPPYAPQLNPIEVCFGRLKRWIQRHANLAFPLYPEKVLEVAMPLCIKTENGTGGEFSYCGYKNDGLDEKVFEDLCNGNG